MIDAFDLTWKPLITGDDARPFLEKIHQFAEILVKEAGKSNDVGVLTGQMGIVLFLYYYSLLVERNEYRDTAFSFVSEIFDRIETQEVEHTFCEGLAGVGWGLQHLADQGFVEAEIDETLEELDEFASDVLDRYIEDRNFDFLQGAVGIGLYLINRMPQTTAAQSLQKLLDNLERHSSRGANGAFFWQTIIDPSDGALGCNLSLSHGMSAIVNLLARMARVERFRQQALPLVEGGCRFLLDQRLPQTDLPSLFPSIVTPKEPLTVGRLAWCYGDLGLALGFLHGFDVSGNRKWLDAAVEVFIHASTRRELQATGVQDACVCHGSAGVAHIFNRIYQKTGDPRLLDAALYWLQDTLNHARYHDGYAGYKMRHPEIKGGWQPETNLLEGIAGIGLVFISTVSTIEPAWDQCLMIGR